MSSALQSAAFSALRQNNYASLAVLTALAYDYVLVFPKEIEYIWSTPWTRVSTMFILVRYCGLYNLAIDALCQILNVLQTWSYVLFLGAADLTMILRIWAMYNKSRLILVTLLTLVSVEITSFVVVAAAYIDPMNDQYFTIQVLEYSVCAEQIASPVWEEVTDILQMIFGGVLCILAIIRFARQSIPMYNTRRPWYRKVNRYMDLLVKQGILYFVVIFLLNFTSILNITGKIPSTGWGFLLAAIMEILPVYILTPRFIISIREMYAHDVQGRHGGAIDTGFGLSILSSRSGVTREPITFTAGGQNEVADNFVEAVDGQTEGIEMEAVNGQNKNRDIEEVPRGATTA